VFFIGTFDEKAEYRMRRFWRKHRQRRSKRAGSQSGQGTLEYILVLLIVVIIILSVVYRFNTSFKVYAEAFFDGYIACLLETGELPGVKNSQCIEEFKDFDPKAGKAYLSGNLPPGGSGGGGNKAGDSKKDSASKGKTETVGSRSGSSYVGTVGGNGRFGTSVVSRSGGGSPTASSSSDDKAGTNGITMGGSSTVARMQPDSRRNKVVMVYDSTLSSDDKKDEDKTKPKKVATKDNSEDRLRPSKAVETGARGPAAKITDSDGEFSIGALVRLLIIILIVVAMIIFFGGQLLQIARSQEKGGDGG
jgi:hypothetical protein